MSARVLMLALGLSTIACLALVRAQPARVAFVLVPEHGDAASRELSARLSGELAAEGFSVTRRVSPEGLTPREAVESAQADANAVLLITPAEHGALAIWLSDRLAGHTSVARLRGEAESLTPAQLTVRAVELLRARLSEHALSTAPDDAWQVVPADAPAREVAPPMPEAPEPRELGLMLGVGLLQGALGTHWLPVLGFSFGIPVTRRFALELGLNGGGFGTRARVAREQGSARVAQAFATAHAAWRLRSEPLPEPSVRVLAGALVMPVEGRAATPYEARDERHASPFVGAGLGLRSPAWGPLRALLSADLLLFTRPGVVRVAMHDVARMGNVGALLRAELAVTF